MIIACAVLVVFHECFGIEIVKAINNVSVTFAVDVVATIISSPKVLIPRSECE